MKLKVDVLTLDGKIEKRTLNMKLMFYKYKLEKLYYIQDGNIGIYGINEDETVLRWKKGSPLKETLDKARIEKTFEDENSWVENFYGNLTVVEKDMFRLYAIRQLHYEYEKGSLLNHHEAKYIAKLYVAEYITVNLKTNEIRTALKAHEGKQIPKEYGFVIDDHALAIDVGSRVNQQF